MSCTVTNGGSPVKIKKINTTEECKKYSAINNPSLEKAKNILETIKASQKK